MILLAETLHAHFQLVVVDTCILGLFSLVYIGEVVGHQLGIEYAITSVALPSALNLFDFFQKVVTGLLLDPPSLPVLLIPSL